MMPSTIISIALKYQKQVHILVPIAIFFTLYIKRIFYLGLYHDDWSLFSIGNVNSLGATVNQYADRPVIGFLFYIVNHFWNGSPATLSLIASLLVASTATCLFLCLSALTKPLNGNLLAPSIATAIWLALPWGMGYSLWPTGAVTLIAFSFFLISSIFIVSYIQNSRPYKLAMIAFFILLSFLTYQSWFLSYVPFIALVYVITPPFSSKYKNTLMVFILCTLCQLATIAWTKITTPKTLNVNINLLLNNLYNAPFYAIKSSFSNSYIFYLFFSSVFLTLVIFLSVLIFRKSFIAKKKIFYSIVISSIGFLISTLPYSLANYGIAGVGVSSKTTMGINFWLTIFIYIVISQKNKNQSIKVISYIATLFILISLTLASTVQIKYWEDSRIRQQQILDELPLTQLSKVDKSAIVILDEPTDLKGVVVFGAPWDINPAITDYLRRRGNLQPQNHPEFFTMNTPFFWKENGDVIFEWGEIRKNISEIWIYMPSKGEFKKLEIRGKYSSNL